VKQIISMDSIHFRIKEIDQERIDKIRTRLKSVDEKNDNSHVVRFAIEYTVSNWFPVKKNGD